MKCNCSCVFDWTGLDYKWIPQLLRFHRDIKHTCYMMPVCPKTILRNYVTLGCRINGYMIPFL